MKYMTLSSNLASSHKENLLLAYAFLNNKLLNNPECSFINNYPKERPEEGYIFGKDTLSAVYGNGNEIPSWDKFYKIHKDDEKTQFMCVAGCDEKDKTRITMSVLPKEIMQEFPEEKRGMFISISKSVSKRKVQYIIDSIINLYEQYKTDL